MKRMQWSEYQDRVADLDREIRWRFPGDASIHLIGIPRGGLLVALHLTYMSKRYDVINDYNIGRDERNDVVLVDDVMESGATRSHWFGALRGSLGGKAPLFAVMVDKSPCYPGVIPANICSMRMTSKEWIVFPYEWEEDEGKREAVYRAGHPEHTGEGTT